MSAVPAPVATDDYDYVWDAIDSGKFELLKNLAPEEFNWRSLHPTKKITVLHTMLSNFILCDEDEEDDYLAMSKWLISKGSDPRQKAADDSEEAWSFFNRAKREETETEDFDYAGASTVSLALRMQSAFLESHADQKNDWSSEMRHVSLLLDIFATHKPGPSCAAPRLWIHESVVDTWENVYNSDKFADLTIECKGGAEVRCHCVVVAQVSEVLHAMLTSNMQESKEKRIVVPDAHPFEVRLFLEVSYCGCVTGDGPDVETIVGAMDLAHRWSNYFAVNFFENLLVGKVSTENFEILAETATLKQLPALLQKLKEFARLSKDLKKQFMENKCPAASACIASQLWGGEHKPAVKKRRTC